MNRLKFEGNGVDYFKIWIVNILLVIVTLSLYTPWAKVRNRRYFYANTTLEGRNFEYHATGKQLFISYVIAMVLFIIFISIQNTSPTGSGIIMLLFFLAFPWIIWKSLKFNMKMTSFSNVRFDFDGLLGGAYINFLLLPILGLLAVYALPIILTVTATQSGMEAGVVMFAMITIGAIATALLAVFVSALIKRRNTSYAIDGYSYGQGEFSTHLETGKFAMITLKTVGLALLAALAISAVAGLIGGLTGGAELLGAGEDMEDVIQAKMGLLFFFSYVGFILVGITAFAYQYTRQREYIYANSNLDKKFTFASTLKARSLINVMITNFLLVIITGGLMIPWARVRMAKLIVENTAVNTDHGFDEYLTQSEEHQSSLGDQLGDAFDVDVGIGF